METLEELLERVQQSADWEGAETESPGLVEVGDKP